MPLDRISAGSAQKSSAGFTLLELLIVIAVLGILAAIAIQNVALYRARSVDASMRSDLRNAAMAMESYYGEFLAYPSTDAALLLNGYRRTTGVTLTINLTTPSTYTLTAARPSGSQASFTFDSTTGLIN
jgi:prepilin-type N-terminal cleavage/methylation domain-containing protein